MTNNSNNDKRNGRWIRLGKAIGALAVAVGALATSITGLVKSDDAQDQVQDVGHLAVDLANSTDTDAAYEALQERCRFLERQIEALQRRVDGLHRERPRPTWGAGVPKPVLDDAADEVGVEGSPESETAVTGQSPSTRRATKPPRKLADLPSVKASRAARAGMVRQVQDQLRIRAPLPAGD